MQSPVLYLVLNRSVLKRFRCCGLSRYAVSQRRRHGQIRRPGSRVKLSNRPLWRLGNVNERNQLHLPGIVCFGDHIGHRAARLGATRCMVLGFIVFRHGVRR